MDTGDSEASISLSISLSVSLSLSLSLCLCLYLSLSLSLSVLIQSTHLSAMCFSISESRLTSKGGIASIALEQLEGQLVSNAPVGAGGLRAVNRRPLVRRRRVFCQTDGSARRRAAPDKP